MIKSSHVENTRRINAAREMLKTALSPSETAALLVVHYGVSKRQAQRYVQAAVDLSEALPLPEAKVVFTVKLAPSLAALIRRCARQRGCSISDLVAEALCLFLDKGRSDG